jgi:hypothetical protein
MLVRLLQKAHELGYEVTLGEAYRSPEQAARNAAQGTGIRNSLHILRLAVDLNLFRDGVFLSSTEDHRPLGEYWESVGGSWGGRFSKPDGNHYSLEYQGVR